MNDGVEEVCWRFGCWTEQKMREKNIGASCLSMVGNKACSPREGMKEALRPDLWNIIIYQISKPLCLHFIGMTSLCKYWYSAFNKFYFLEFLITKLEVSCTARIACYY